MEWVEILLKTSAVLTAIGIVWKWISGVGDKIDALKDDIQELKDHSVENYLSGLRLTIMSPYMPIGERVVAADKYLKAGGNGDVKEYAIKELHIRDVYNDK